MTNNVTEQVRTRRATGVPTWIDFMAADAAATATFFGELLGWESQESGPEFGGYRTCSIDGRNVSGIGPATAPSMPDVQTVYLATDNIEATVNRADELGAEIMRMGPTGEPIMTVGSHGRMALLADPAGATIGLWQADEMTGFQAEHTHGAPDWFEVASRDVAATTRFYAELFGFSFSNQSDEMTYECAQNDDGMHFGVMEMPEAMPATVPSYWMAYYKVDSLDAAAARVVELGGTVVAGPESIPEGRWLCATTPGGAVFGLFSSPTE